MNKEKTIHCAYCLDEHPNTAKDIAAHMLSCEKRPEMGLILKIELMNETGDILLKTIHDMCKMIAEIEGTRTTVWEVYRQCQENWEIVKNVQPFDLAEAVRDQL